MCSAKTLAKTKKGEKKKQKTDLLWFLLRKPEVKQWQRVPEHPGALGLSRPQNSSPWQVVVGQTALQQLGQFNRLGTD